MFLIALIPACGTEVSITTPPPTIPPQVAQLANWIEGNFTSSKDVNAPGPKDISLHAVRIWPEKLGTRWIYIEEAQTNNLDQPISQRIYEVTTGTHAEIAVRIFILPYGSNPPPGSYADPDWFQRIDPAFILSLGGCTLHFLANGKDSFTGKTIGKGCTSSRRGAAYSTSESTVSAQEIRSWNRGWDAQDAQVWGPTDSPIVFTRIGS
jgi:hypothetical protein